MAFLCDISLYFQMVNFAIFLYGKFRYFSDEKYRCFWFVNIWLQISKWQFFKSFPRHEQKYTVFQFWMTVCSLKQKKSNIFLIFKSGIQNSLHFLCFPSWEVLWSFERKLFLCFADASYQMVKKKTFFFSHFGLRG